MCPPHRGCGANRETGMWAGQRHSLTAGAQRNPAMPTNQTDAACEFALMPHTARELFQFSSSCTRGKSSGTGDAVGRCVSAARGRVAAQTSPGRISDHIRPHLKCCPPEHAHSAAAETLAQHRVFPSLPTVAVHLLPRGKGNAREEPVSGPSWSSLRGTALSLRPHQPPSAQKQDLCHRCQLVPPAGDKGLTQDSILVSPP